jgi:5-hydroxyisourate hydrolase
MALGMNKISTHVLDTMMGKGATGLVVFLDRREPSGQWLTLGVSRTDQDGRCNQLLQGDADLSPGIYRLMFDTAVYFLHKKVVSLYPAIEVTFEVREGESHFHIPLLLSPNGYTTYRGT